MSKTVDKVDHTELLVRLHQYGITGKRPFILTGTQATGYSSQIHFPRIAGYIQGTTRVLIRGDIVSVVCE